MLEHCGRSQWLQSSGFGKQTYVLGEMTRLTTLAALYALGRTRLVTLLRVVSLLLAVPAGMWVDALLRAVTSAVTFFGTVDTLDGRCH